MQADDAVRYHLDCNLEIRIDEAVLEKLFSHRQCTYFHKEAGGQLFAVISKGVWNLVEATGPRRSDHRSRYSYVPDRAAEQIEIDEQFVRGRHYVGDWHTHPQRRPRPSVSDISSISTVARQTQHELPGFLLMIVGTRKAPGDIWVSLHDGAGRNGIRLVACKDRTYAGMS
jgi:integrative and conjugative element protein (TIGR02256 family)